MRLRISTTVIAIRRVLPAATSVRELVERLRRMHGSLTDRGLLSGRRTRRRFRRGRIQSQNQIRHVARRLGHLPAIDGDGLFDSGAGRGNGRAAVAAAFAKAELPFRWLLGDGRGEWHGVTRDRRDRWDGNVGGIDDISIARNLGSPADFPR